MSLVPDSRARRGSALLVSADRPWLAATTAFLVGSTHSIRTAETVVEAIDLLVANLPDVTVVAPPVADGRPLTLIGQVGVLREQRRLGVVYVAERDRELADHSRLLRAGVNDWFPRGIAAPEAAKRITALIAALREDDGVALIERGPLAISVLTRSASVGGLDIGLSDREFSILLRLALAAGRTMDPTEIARAIGMRRHSGVTITINDALQRIHEKLGGARGLLELSRRYGHRLRFVAPP